MERRLINPTRAPRRPTDPHPTDPAPNVKAAAEHGLYAPAYEHDACGVSFVVDLHGRRSHRLVQQALTSLCNLEHRGATGAEENSGDGAGILVGVPDRFLRSVVGTELPPAGHYAAGIGFLPRDDGDARAVTDAIEDLVLDEGLCTIAWRDVPVDPSMLGSWALDAMPRFVMLIVADPEDRPGGRRSGIDLDRAAYPLRKRIEHELGQDVGGETVEGVGVDGGETAYFASLSSRTIVYKGMLTTPQLGAFFADLTDERFESSLALVHSRFSTNTFPSWPLAHPYRYIAHNGEINTVQGNQNWMRAREAMLSTDLIEGDLDRLFPICTPGASDTARFDEALELLHLGGYSLPHAVLMMIPEAWENHTSMDPALRAFYEYHSCLMEPWDGPASITFTDGTIVGAVLDRNGLRPSRYWVTDDGLVVMASEVGTLEIPTERIVRKGRLQPGRMFLIDTDAGRIIEDSEIKAQLAAAHPYQRWLDDGLIDLEALPAKPHFTEPALDTLRAQQVFGYTLEEIRILLTPMARDGKEALGSMGTDTPIAVLSDRPRLLFDYFTQLFAQVTNPPLDAIREELVTSLGKVFGPEGNILDLDPADAELIEVPYPVLNNDQLRQLRDLDDTRPHGFQSRVLYTHFGVAAGGAGLAADLERLRSEVSAAIEEGVNVVILSDRFSTEDRAPIPMLLATSAVHHHLVRTKARTRVGLIVESGECREVHHFATLIGYGAAAVNPYTAFDTIENLVAEGRLGDVSFEQAVANYVRAAGQGILKVMSKMGISTVASYTGAQIFEAIGLGHELVDEYFTGTVSRLGGIGLDEIAEAVRRRHALAWPDRPEELAHRPLEAGGEYQWRREGEYHLFNPKTVFKLQHATRSKSYAIFKEYTTLVDDQSEQLATLRGLFTFDTDARPSVPLDEVEPVSAIVKRFSTGAMSYGSISAEAHQTLAIAMNRLGAKSNTGEGGEDADRYLPDANGDLRRSAIKQVASGRFGVTSHYLTNADDLQIKMAQGAKPGEGGQLPGHKVYPWIAGTRHSTPGVGLISPPPHHDIYSIEDLAQLIHDLKNANPEARIHVKLVAEVGVGTVAAGVAKAKADVVLISGHDGGTGASPLTSLKHAGAPWELGLAETQQTLLVNGLRDRIVVQVDGQLKTGRDVVIGALLGAEEFGFATAPLVVSGCVMMRVCHLDTCPVGIATQNPELRSRFAGQADHVVNFMEFIAEEVRELLAELGFRTLEEAVGHAELLDTRAAINHWKAAGLDLSPILYTPEPSMGTALHHTTAQDHGLQRALDHTLIALSEGAIADGTPVRLELPIRNVNRTVGTMLGHEVTKAWGAEGLPDDTITIDFTGSAGNSFGAFLPRGITLGLFGDANDYVGKGLSGGRLVLAPPLSTHPSFVAADNIIAGNVMAYGATGGEMFVRGQVGERCCVRNSGALVVTEGVGDHGCEYMTGGRAVVLGPTGRNFGAGMSGGIAYVWDPDGALVANVNPGMVVLQSLAGGSPDGHGDRRISQDPGADAEFLREVIARHVEATGSEVGAELLGRWPSAAEEFTKVMPTDYQRVLEVTAKAEAEGLDADATMDAVMAAARA
ncbi:MAG: glutamate synthase large subunit [Candidatus Microthrix subdominans]|jgi:glutamate synthase (NADPH/NADH) large chain|nr:glutamate synthase large subunit [Candidatus Microthrix sp.]MBK9560420.1 glutamate synthase large subunit [Candidatus Microthrix sp.]MBP7595179.1 glutamate synthase large subunit [Candidatus Microthrix sp.]